jgi:hypothetical protein
MTKQPIFSIWSLAVCILLLLSIVLGLQACTKDEGFPKPPLILPLSLEKAGSKIETDLRVVDHNIYYFSLNFSYKEKDEVDRARVKILIGGNEIDKYGKALHPGVPTPVILRVSAIEAGQENAIYSKEINPILTSWGADSFGKTIGFTELKPGLYKVQLENLRSSPEFNGTPVYLGIGYSKYKQRFIPKEK